GSLFKRGTRSAERGIELEPPYVGCYEFNCQRCCGGLGLVRLRRKHFFGAPKKIEPRHLGCYRGLWFHGMGMEGFLRWRSRRRSFGRCLNHWMKRTSCLTASSEARLAFWGLANFV